MAKRDRARSVDRTSSTPLWKQLEVDLYRRMDAGAFERAFPGEHELAEEYQVSRHTVREALRRMRADGVLSSGRGRGTSVRPRAIEQPLGTLYSLFRSVESSGVEQRSEVRVLDVREAPAVAARLEHPAGTEFVYLERLRLADSEPLALDRTWLPRSLAEPLLSANFSHSGLYDELARLTGIRLTGGREVIRAAVADAATRKLLAIPATTGILAVERTACLGDSRVEFRETLIRGDRFAMIANWSARDGFRLAVGGLDPQAV